MPPPHTHTVNLMFYEMNIISSLHIYLGTEQRASAEQRKKEAYRRELEQQMRELREKRTR